MRLSKSVDYSLRLLIYLAQNKELVTMPVLAEKLDIPYNHLTKIVNQLNRAEMIQTRQGKSGGVALLADPETIDLKKVVELTDGPTKLSECLAHGRDCRFDAGCKLKSVLGEVQRGIDKLLEDKKLSQLI